MCGLAAHTSRVFSGSLRLCGKLRTCFPQRRKDAKRACFHLSEVIHCCEALCDNVCCSEHIGLSSTSFMRRILFAFLVLSILCFGITAQSPFSINDVINMKRVGDPQISPDGRTIAYTIGVADKAANK